MSMLSPVWQIGKNTSNYRCLQQLSVCFTRQFSSDNVKVDFEKALNQVNKLRSEPENDSKLKLYALYKQSTIGPCNVKKPGMFDMVAKFKWEAWSNLGDLKKEDAMKMYIQSVEELIQSIGISEQSNEASSSGSSGNSDGDLLVTIKEGVLTITLNRPMKMNSITIDMYKMIPDILKDAAKNPEIKMSIITGNGDYYSSGNDLTLFSVKGQADLEALANMGKEVLENFVNSLIDFPKPLVACVNGPSIGIMTTTLALFDTVICSDTATFHTPFLTTSQTPEGCSTVTFARIMGNSKANSMLLFNEKLTAEQAYQCGFVSKIVPKNELNNYIQSWLYGEKGLITTGSTNMWLKAKQLIRTDEEKAMLRRVNKIECEELAKIWLTPDFAKAMAKFFQRKN